MRKLFVLWREPTENKRRHPIGELRREDGLFRFAYGDLFDAVKAGFHPLREFSDPMGEYESGYLFGTFAQRIPDPRRSDYREMLQGWGLEPSCDDPLQILAASGGILVTDRLEFAEYRGPHDPLTTPLEFRIAAQQRFSSESPAPAPRPGDRLTLERDQDNEVDRFASYIVSDGSRKIGRVPRQYSELVARHLDGGSLLDVVVMRQILVPADVGRLVVAVSKK